MAKWTSMKNSSIVKKTKIPVCMFLALAGMAAGSMAQSPSPAKATTPAPAAAPPATLAKSGDPFVKNKEAEHPADAAPPANVCFTVEIYTLAQDDAARLLADNPGGAARHDAVLKLAVEGKARFEALLSDVTKSGQRTVVGQCDEVRYPTEYLPSPVPGEPPLPTVFETRDTGQTLEYEPVTSPDNSVCDINIALSSTHFNGFAEFGGRPQDPLVAQPKFDTGELTTSMKLVMGKLHFLGTISTSPQFTDDAGTQATPQQVKLAFGRASLVPVTSGTSGPQEEGSLMEHQLIFYSMDREAARKILAGDPAPGSYHAAVQALAAKQEAHLERLTVLNTMSGQRAVVEEVNEMRNPTDYGFFQKNKSAEETEKAMPPLVPPTFPANTGTQAAPAPSATPAPALPSVYVTIHPVQTPVATGTAYKPGSDQEYLASSFDTRNAGLTLEIEPVAQKSIVDINIAPGIVRDLGGLQGNGVARKYPAIPVFETNKVTTSIAAPMGVYAYIGTFNPPGDTGVNGRKDTGKVWLGFIRTVYAQP